MLTGKCKEDFRNWYLGYELNNESVDDLPPKELYKLPLSMQFGVYVDFFDSVGIFVECSMTKDGRFYSRSRMVTRMYMTGKWIWKTRNEARQKAIEKANEIYNQNEGK